MTWDFKIRLDTAVEVVLILLALGALYQRMTDSQNSVIQHLSQIDVTTATLGKELNKINDWRSHVNDYFCFKDPSGCRFFSEYSTSGPSSGK